MKTDCNIQRSVSELGLAKLCLSLPSTCSTGIYKFEPVKVSSLLSIYLQAISNKCIGPNFQNTRIPLAPIHGALPAEDSG